MSWHFTPPWLYKCCIQHLKRHPIHGCKETLVLSLNRTFPLGGHSPRRQMYVCWVSRFRHVWFFATSQTVAHQAPLSMGFSRQNTGVGCHALLQGIFSTQGSNPGLLCLLHWWVRYLPLASPGKPSDTKSIIEENYMQRKRCHLVRGEAEVPQSVCCVSRQKLNSWATWSSLSHPLTPLPHLLIAFLTVPDNG